MTTIETVLGPVPVEDLGHVLVHEHVVASSPGILTSWPDLFGSRQALVERGVAALRDARDAGVGSMVDCTTFDLGRDAALLAEVSEASASDGPSGTMARCCVMKSLGWSLSAIP